MTIAYRYGRGLYLNITNRCPIACVFCIRRVDDYQLGRLNLRLAAEPGLDDVQVAIDELISTTREFDEVVFCGMGEPLMRLDVVLSVSANLSARGIPVRVDTCGLANLIHGRDVTPELGRVVREVSISLNAANAADYARVCPSKHGEAAYESLMEFIGLARERFERVVLSTVHPNAYEALGLECPVDPEECRAVADRFGLPLRIRGR